MNTKDCFKLGKFTKPFRYQGEVILWMDVDDRSPYSNIKVVWVEERKSLVPYMITKLKPHNDRFVAKIEGVNSEQGAKSICGKDVYLPISELPKLNNYQFYFHEVSGWTVLDLNTGEEVGKIQQVLNNGPYPMLDVDREGVELILPLPENFKLEVERENKILKVEIPVGLVEVFTEDDDECDEDIFPQ